MHGPLCFLALQSFQHIICTHTQLHYNHTIEAFSWAVLQLIFPVSGLLSWVIKRFKTDCTANDLGVKHGLPADADNAKLFAKDPQPRTYNAEKTPAASRQREVDAEQAYQNYFEYKDSLDTNDLGLAHDSLLVAGRAGHPDVTHEKVAGSYLKLADAYRQKNPDLALAYYKKAGEWGNAAGFREAAKILRPGPSKLFSRDPIDACAAGEYMKKAVKMGDEEAKRLLPWTRFLAGSEADARRTIRMYNDEHGIKPKPNGIIY